MEATSYSNFRIREQTLFGGQYISFYIEAEQQVGKAFFTIIFADLRDFLHQQFPSVAGYIDAVRTSMGGYGPKEFEILQVLREEEFDFEPYMIRYIESKPGAVAEQIEQQKAFFANPEQQKQLKEKLAVLDTYNHDNYINGDKFLDGLEKAILDYLIDNYPELTSAEPDDIRKLKHLLISDVMRLGEKLIKHIMEIRRR